VRRPGPRHSARRQGARIDRQNRSSVSRPCAHYGRRRGAVSHSSLAAAADLDLSDDPEAAAEAAFHEAATVRPCKRRTTRVMMLTIAHVPRRKRRPRQLKAVPSGADDSSA
jgi:hypothetical protein